MSEQIEKSFFHTKEGMEITIALKEKIETGFFSSVIRDTGIAKTISFPFPIAFVASLKKEILELLQEQKIVYKSYKTYVGNGFTEITSESDRFVSDGTTVFYEEVGNIYQEMNLTGWDQSRWEQGRRKTRTYIVRPKVIVIYKKP